MAFSFRRKIDPFAAYLRTLVEICDAAPRKFQISRLPPKFCTIKKSFHYRVSLRSAQLASLRSATVRISHLCCQFLRFRGPLT